MSVSLSIIRPSEACEREKHSDMSSGTVCVCEREREFHFFMRVHETRDPIIDGNSSAHTSEQFKSQ